MESVQYHGMSMGGKIYSLRMAKRMSQEQLAAVLCISRAEGLLTMESYIPKLKGESRFLAFAIPCVLNLYMAQAEFEEPFRLLENYAATLTNAELPEGKMITAVLRKIFAEHLRSTSGN